jgi:hypothetical protein
MTETQNYNPTPSMNSRPSPVAPARPLTPGVARIALVVGGTHQGLVRHARSAAADLMLYVDVPNELSAARPGKGVLRQALVPGETLGSLVKHGCSPAVHRLHSTRPGVNLEIGLGQLRAIGKLAGENLFANGEFERFTVAQLFDPLMIQHNGAIQQVEITVFASAAGGTGSPLGPMIANAIKEVFVDRLDAVVSVNYLRAGSLTFLSLGPRVHANAAAAVDEDLAYLCATDQHEREVRSTLFFEAPMVKDRKSERDGFILEFSQALRARAVREILDRRSPNAALDSPLGTVRILRASRWNALSPRRIAGEMARQYLPELQQIRNTGATPGQVRGIEVVLQSSPAPGFLQIAEVRSVMSRAGKVAPPGLLEICLTAPEVYPGSMVTIQMNSDRVQLEEDFQMRFGTSAFTAAEFVEKLGALAGIRGALEAEISAVAGRTQVVERKLGRVKSLLEQQMQHLYPVRFWNRVVASLGNPQSRLQVFFTLVNNGRELLRDEARLKAQAGALHAMLSKVCREIEREQARLDQLIQFLARHRPASVADAATGCVELVPLEVMLPELLEVLWQSSAEALAERLASGVERVTLAGLAEITGASDATPEAVAAALVLKAPPHQAPVWGGKIPLTVGRTILVLPPVAEGVETAVGEAVARFDGDSVVVQADCAQAGVNVLGIEVREPQARSEIFTSFYNKAIETARKDPELYFTRNGHHADANGHLVNGAATHVAPAR